MMCFEVAGSKAEKQQLLFIITTLTDTNTLKLLLTRNTKQALVYYGKIEREDLKINNLRGGTRNREQRIKQQERKIVRIYDKIKQTGDGVILEVKNPQKQKI